MASLSEAIDATLNRDSAGQECVRDVPHTYPRNERLHLDDVLRRLQQRPLSPQPRLHVGIAGFANFDIAAVTRPAAMLLLDNNLSQRDFWQMVVQVLDGAASPEAFVPALMEAIRTHEDADIRAIDTQALGDYLGREAVWLRSPAAYAYVRQRAQSGNIAAGTLDMLTAGDAPCKLGNMLRRSGLAVDTAYWSNLWYFCRPVGPDGVGHSLSEPVYPQQGMSYVNRYFGAPEDGMRLHVRGEVLQQGEWRGQPFVPLFERFMQNVSDVGGQGTLHILTSHLPDLAQGLAQEQQQEYPELAAYGRHKPLHGRPVYIEGSPRRSQAAWALREQVRERDTVGEGRAF